MTAKPYELLARFNPDGTIRGVATRTLTTVNGRNFPSDPVPLSDATDPAFVAFADSFAAAAVAERDALKAELDALKAERSYDARMIDPAAWYARFTMDNILAISSAAADDAVAKSFVDLLADSRRQRLSDPLYQMNLDSETTQQGVAYLQSIGAITDDDAARVLADATESEQ